MSNVKITLYTKISPVMSDMINELMNKWGFVNHSEIIRLAIAEKYSRDIGNGVRPSNEMAFTPGRPKMTRENKEEKKQLEIIEALGAKIEDRGGSKVVVYTIYEKTTPIHVEKYDQELPLSHLTESLIDSQYKPSKAECLAIMKKEKENPISKLK